MPTKNKVSSKALEVAAPAVHSIPSSMDINQVVPAALNANKMDKVEFARYVSDVKDAGRLFRPIIVRPIMDGEEQKFQIVDGHHSYAAAVQAGLDTVPVVIKELTDEQAVIEGLKANNRGNANPLILGRMFAVGDLAGMTNQAIADLLGWSEGNVRVYKRYWTFFSETVNAMIEAGHVSDPEDWADHIGGLTVRGLDALAKDFDPKKGHDALTGDGEGEDGGASGKVGQTAQQVKDKALDKLNVAAKALLKAGVSEADAANQFLGFYRAWVKASADEAAAAEADAKKKTAEAKKKAAAKKKS